MNRALRIGACSGLLLVVGIYTSGCTSSKPEVVTVEGTATQSRLTAVAWLYTLHVDLRGRPPATYEELRVFAETLPPAHGGPSSLSEAFLISPRDNKPLMIRYGLPLSPDRSGPVIAYEQEGVNGQRFVVYGGTSRIEQVNEARFKELVSKP